MAYLPSRLEGGTVVSGDYPTIEWGSGSYFLTTKIDTNGGANYLITAITELLSVPLANFAFEAGKLSGPAGNFVGWYNQTAALYAAFLFLLYEKRLFFDNDMLLTS
jgi:hypothetical protein